MVDLNYLNNHTLILITITMNLYKENILCLSNIFVVKEERLTANDFPLHFHPEYELILILRGSGKRFVGDNVSEFDKDDLCFFGPDLPHTYNNKHLSRNKEMHQIVVQFSGEFLGKNFFESSPFKLIRSLFNHSMLGYNFKGQTVCIVKEKMIEMVKMDEMQAVIELLSILDILSRSTEYQFLVSPGFNKITNREQSERMSRVHEYILKNFMYEISLNEIASIACLSPEAFCRYFKKNTRKTLSQYLIELRVGYACKLLQESDLSVSQISNQCGFNNISYFNRKFKSLYRKTPLEYQRVFSRDARNILDYTN